MLRSAPLWIEVMSLESRLEEVIRSMHGLLAWLLEVSGSLLSLLFVGNTANKKAAIFDDLFGVTSSLSQPSVTPPLLVLEGLPPVVDALLLPRPTMRTASIPHRLTSLANLITTTYILASERDRCKQSSHVTAFLGAPNTWGLLLRTIDVRPKRLTCVATSSR
jgi:hypothetical protein